MSYSAESFEPLRQTIEQASKIVISSTVSKEEREEAEKIFIQFKESKSPYDFCYFLLQKSSDSHVLFQAVSTIQAAALREWPLLSTETILALQTNLFDYVTESRSIEQYVQKQILQTVAVFYKRTKFDTFHSKHLGQQKNSQIDNTNLVTRSIELFSCSDLKKRQLMCSFLFAVINEFSNTNKSTKLGQSTESHFNAKRSFEQNEFKSILLFVFDTAKSLIDSLIQSNITNICSVDKESKNLLIQIFNLIDQSFTWEFTSSRHVLKNLIGFTNQSAIKSLEPTPEFRDFFLNPQLVQLLFRCYQLVRDDPDTAHF
ncbi:exportin-4-like, partial [Brachionus plicatilis]